MTDEHVVTFEMLSAAALRGVRWQKYAAEHGLSGDWKRAHRYGMTRYELHALYVNQGGCCYLCGDLLPKNLAKTVVDHDHSCCFTPPGQPSTSKTSCGRCVRGLACAPCNRLIAAANDDPDRLRRVADNLEAANIRVGRSERQPLRIPPPLTREDRP